jgi:hypothetical protein
MAREKIKVLFFITFYLVIMPKVHPHGAAAKRSRQFKETMGARKDRRERQLKRLNKKLNKLDEFLETAEPRKGPLQLMTLNMTKQQTAINAHRETY